MKKKIEYKNDDITVVWKPDVCIHSTLCWKGLFSVFNPKARPWVNMKGATTEKIIDQVRHCPSGALSYYLNNEKNPSTNNDVKSEEAKILTIRVSSDGPYLIDTECLVIHTDGREEVKKGTVALCRCGASAKKPYCDGSHNKIDFKG